ARDSRVASATSGGTFHVEVGGTNVTGTIAAPGTGGWQTWQTVTTSGVALSAGPQVMRIVFDTGSFNLNKVTWTLDSASSGGGSSAAGSGGGGHHCGATGLEALALLGLAVLL